MQGKWISLCYDKLCRRDWLNAFMNNNLSSRLSSFPMLQNLVEQIFPPSGKPDSSTQHGHLGQNLPKKEYELILAYLNDNHSLPTFRHFKDFPHPTDQVLAPSTHRNSPQQSRIYAYTILHKLYVTFS
jgi:hypothetical protein